MAVKLKCAARVAICTPGKMTKRGRLSIAGWLHKQADALINEGHNYVDSGRFTARYLYAPRGAK